jgi:hypothetical protein
MAWQIVSHEASMDAPQAKRMQIELLKLSGTTRTGTSPEVLGLVGCDTSLEASLSRQK